jgi:hypothetical protein
MVESTLLIRLKNGVGVVVIPFGLTGVTLEVSNWVVSKGGAFEVGLGEREPTEGVRGGLISMGAIVTSSAAGISTSIKSKALPVVDRVSAVFRVLAVAAASVYSGQSSSNLSDFRTEFRACLAILN